MTSPATASMSCTLCRTRRVKCDRQLPGCKRCEKLAQPCPGYCRSRRFRDEGPSLRKKFGTASEEAISSPKVTKESPCISLTHVVEEASAIPQYGDSSFDEMYFDIDPDVYWAQEANSCGLVPTLSASDLDVSLDQFSPSHAESLGEVSKDGEVQGNWLAEIFLPRRFAEVIGPWLDVMNTEKYFGHVIPLRARRSGLIKSSVAAVAAKQYGGQEHKGGDGLFTYGLEGPDGSEARAVDWAFEAASFYDTAIRQMMRAVSEYNRLSLVADVANKLAGSIGRGYGTRPVSLSRPGGFETAEQEKFGDLLAAIAIFLVYESINDEQPSMVQHIAGAHQLVQQVVQQHFGLSPSALWGVRSMFDKSFNKAWEASFWNFATFDYITSYSMRSKPCLDHADTRLWQAAGLPMASKQEQHVPEFFLDNAYSSSPRKLKEVEACRVLIWIVIRSLTFIANAGTKDTATEVKEVDQCSERGCWHDIEDYLSRWHAAIPETFELLSRVTSTKVDRRDLDSTYSSSASSSPTTIPFPQLFFTNSMATSALLLYHFTCLLMLLQRIPGHGETRLSSDASPDMSRVRYHAEEICGMASGGPQAEAQIHLLQPLHLAGLCLESYHQKIILANLLVGLQRRSGCSTVWKLEDLKKVWGWEADIVQQSIQA